MRGAEGGRVGSGLTGPRVESVRSGLNYTTPVGVGELLGGLGENAPPGGRYGASCPGEVLRRK